MESVSPLSPFPTEELPLPKRSRKSKKWVVVFVLIIFLGSLVFGGYRYIAGNKKNQQSLPITPSPTQDVFPTDTPFIEPTKSLTPTATPVPTAKPSSNPLDKTTGLNRASILVDVQNGSGEVGAASKGADTLKSFGYKVGSVGNADAFTYEGAVVRIKDSKKEYLPLLKKDLSSAYTLGTTSTDLSASSSADALVIFGK